MNGITEVRSTLDISRSIVTAVANGLSERQVCQNSRLRMVEARGQSGAGFLVTSAIVCGVLLSFAAVAPAATVSAASCSGSGVQNALNSASPGDTVAVPAGSCSWSGVSINKAVVLRGAGIGKTNISLSGSNSITKASGVIRITGFSFSKNGGGNESKGFQIGGSWKNAQPVVIQNNAFTISNTGLFLVSVPGGVIVSNNSFNGGWDDSFLQLKESNDPDGSWKTADTFGTRDSTGTLNIYVEDNTFYGGTNQGLDADDSSRIVFRHNKLTDSSFNTHGMDTSPTGVRQFEVYNNSFYNTSVQSGDTSQLANQNWSVWIRGGTGVIFNNYSDNLAGSYWGNKDELHLSIRGAEDARPQGSCSQVHYPVPRQLGQNYNGSSYFTDPIYIWGNTGTWSIDAGWTWGNPCGFNWSTFFQWGRDAVNTGSAKPGYTAYTYPHPLVQGSNPPPPAAPAPPTSLGTSVH